ncbi:MAG: hypothetical protein Aurels2KO_33630 [Aureliella sp.]
MNRRILTIAWLVMSLTCSVVAADEIRWAPDLLTARKASAQFKVPLMVHFYGDNCLPCKMVEERVFPRPELIQTLNKYFICVKVNGSRNPKVAAEYNVHAWPTDVFIAPDGTQLYSEVSKQDANAYMATLHNVAVRNRDRNTLLAASPGATAQPTQPTATQRPATQPQNHFASNSGQPTNRLASQPVNRFAAQPQSPTGAAQANPTPANTQAGNPPATQQNTVASSNFYQGRPQDTLAPHIAQQQVDRSMQSGPTALGQQVHASTGTTPGQSNNINGVMVPAHPSLLGQQNQRPPASNTAGQPTSSIAGYRAMPTTPPANAAAPAANNSLASNQGTSQSTASQQWNASSAAAGQVIGNPYAKTATAAPSTSQPGAHQQPATTTNRFVGFQKPAAETSEQPATASTGQVGAQTPSALPAGQAPAFEGFCVIEAKLGRWVAGKPEFAVKHRGKVYWLSSLDAQQSFMAQPDRAAPLLAGYDPQVFLTQGRLVAGSIEHTLHERMSDQLLLFSSRESLEAYFPNQDKDVFQRNTQTLIGILKEAGSSN